MDKRLQDRVALVTGASKGIGAEIAARLAAEGAAVAVNYSSSREAADRVVARIVAAGGRAVAVQGDLGGGADARAVVTASVAALGPLDILVNNAGVYAFAPLAEITPAHFHRQFDLNVLGLLLVSQEAVGHFGEKGGSIVNISSGATTMTLPTSAVYTATKASVDAITRVLAKELASRRIRVNAVNPGLIVTEGVIAAGFDQGEFRSGYEATAPLGRLGTVAEIAAVVAFLASDDASFITGETLHATGGLR